MKKKRVSPKHSYQLHFHDTRLCHHCGTEFVVSESLIFDSYGYSGEFHHCPKCDDPFDYHVIKSDFDVAAQEAYDEIKDLPPGKMLSDYISVKFARRVLKLFVRNK